MTNADSRVTIHMAASLDGFIARRDGTVDFMETADHFDGGDAHLTGPVPRELAKHVVTILGSAPDMQRGIIIEAMNPR